MSFLNETMDCQKYQRVKNTHFFFFILNIKMDNPYSVLDQEESDEYVEVRLRIVLYF